jgi:ubiquinone/menaquinone biosynthesis C-methylase UbiE
VTRHLKRDSSARGRYTLRGGFAEDRRLRTQAEHLREHTAALLEPIELADGARALDLGCGPGGALEMLSDLVGPGGRVLGVDLDPGSVAAARTSAQDRGLDNVEIVRADARATGLTKSSFDLVHVRLLLVNISAPEQVVDEIVRLVKPGGWVAVLEPDVALRVCYPPHAALEHIAELLARAYQHNGADLYVARRLPHLLASAGMEKIAVQARAPVCPAGDPQRTVCLDLVQNMRSKILRWGLIRARELDRLDQAARRHLDDPGTLSVPVTYFMAWARKPAADASSG